MRIADSFLAMRERNYRIYFISQLVSVSGTWMQNVAVGWLVLQLTHSGTVLGAVMATRYLPLVLLGPWGGLIADRHNRRLVLICTQTVPLLTSVILGLLVMLDRLSVGALLLATLVLGLVGAFDTPVRQSFITELVPRARIANAIALNSITINLARSIGPAVAGVIIARYSIDICFFLNAATFVWALGCLISLRTVELAPAPRDVRARGQIREGFRYILKTPVLAYSLLMVFVVGALAWEFQVTLPLLATKTFHRGSGGYGSMLGLLGAGAVIGALVATRRRTSNVRSLALASILWGCAILAAALSPNLGVCLVLMLFVGAGSISFNSQAKTILQLSADPRMRGRVMSVWSIAWQGSTLIGAPIVGWVAQVAGARWSLAIGGGSAVLIGAIFARSGNILTAERAKVVDLTPRHP